MSLNRKRNLWGRLWGSQKRRSQRMIHERSARRRHVFLEPLEDRRLLAAAALEAWWPGDGNAQDIQGPTFENGTLQNGATFASGIVHQAFSLDGQNDAVRIANAPNFNANTPFTFETWVQGDPQQFSPDGLFAIADKAHGFVDGTGWVFQGAYTNVGPTLSLNRPKVIGEVAFSLASTSGGDPFIAVGTGVSILDGHWHHLAGVFTGSAIEIYLDGTLRESRSFTGSLLNNNRDLFLGRAFGGGNPVRHFHGLVDEAAFYSRALSSTEIEDIYNSVANHSQAPTANAGGPYEVNEGTPLTLDGSASSDDHGIVTYEWDLDYDGATFVVDLSTTSPMIAHTFADDFAGTIALRVTDASGDSTIEEATLIVHNVAPSNLVLSLSATTINENDSTTLSGTFTDPGSLDARTVTIDWGDGSPAAVLSLPAGVTSIPATSHQYKDDGVSPGNGTASDTYPIRVAVTDDDGGSVGVLSPTTWSAAASLPIPSHSLAATTGLDGRIYAMGGFDLSLDDNTDAMFAYSPNSNTWTQLASMPVSRFGGGAATGRDGRIYAIGGATAPTYTYSSRVDVYDPQTNTWARVADMPTGRGFMGVTTGLDGRIYVIGGFDATLGEHADSVYVYDPDRDAWAQIASLPAGRAYMGAATGQSGLIYAIGGRTPDFDVSSRVDVYDPATDTWQQVASLPSPRQRLAVTAGFDGRIYAIGGVGTPLESDEVEAYDPEANTWVQVANLPAQRGFLAATTGLDGRIYAIGGNRRVADENPEYLGTVEILDFEFVETPATTSVIVQNVAPTLDLGATAPVHEGEFATLSGSFSDPGILDAHVMVVTWGDFNGATSTFALRATNNLVIGQSIASSSDEAVLTIRDVVAGTVSFSVQHRYLDDGTVNGTSQGSFAIDVTLSDDDGGSGSTLPTTSPVFLKELALLPAPFGDSAVVIGDTLYFFGTDSESGSELWKSDGTAAGTQVIDLVSGADGSNPASMIDVNGTLFFSAITPEFGWELWKIASSGADPQLVADLAPGAAGSLAMNLMNVGGTLFFSAFNPDYTAIGLWMSDGTAEGTAFIKDVMLIPSPFSNPVVIGNTVYFIGVDPDSGMELWRSDGTPDGTYAIELVPGPEGSNPFGMENVNGTLFFTASTPDFGSELWKIDAAGAPQLVVDLSPGPDGSGILNLTNVGGTLFFHAQSPTGFGLWTSNGTAAGTVFLTNVMPYLAPFAKPVAVDNTLYVLGFDPATGVELWRSDGTTVGTQAIDLVPGPAGSNPFEMINLNGTLYLSATTPEFGWELWQITGPGSEPQLVSDLMPGLDGSVPMHLTNVGGTLFFSARDPAHPASGLWRLGTPSQPVIVTVNNVAPVITSLNNSSEYGEVLAEQMVTLSAEFVDRGVLDTHSATIDWGDGAFSLGDVTDGPSGVVSSSHAYASAGTYTIRITVSDEVARSDVWTTTAIIADSDGVGPGVEDQGPNGGDGNGDGVLDSLQENVTSLPNAADTQYVTLVTPTGTNLAQVSALNDPSPGVPLPDAHFPLGFFDFAVTGVGAGAPTTVTLLLPPGTRVNTYFKFGATPDDGALHWYEFRFDGRTGAEFFDVNRDGDFDQVVLHFVDGQRGDDDLTSDGRVSDPGSIGFVNHSPEFHPTNPIVAEDTPTPLFLNATDADHDQLTFALWSSPAHGTVVLNSHGEFIYTPAANYFGFDAFQFTVSDGTAVVTFSAEVVVEPVNDPPTANADSATIAGSAVIDVLVNDLKGPANESGQTLVVTAATALHGTVTINSNGTLTYVPIAGYTGPDLISYVIRDNGTTAGVADPMTASSTVAITVNPPPSIVDLIITGTSLNDTIIVEPGTSGTTLKVTLNGAVSTFAKPSERIIVLGGAGDDNIQIAGGITIQAWLYGEAGDDRLNAGNGGSLLIGGDGNDQLLGGSGRDIMIGGQGADNLTGNSNDDILVAGYTDKDSRDSVAHEEFWSSVLHEWLSLDLFGVRVQKLRDSNFVADHIFDDTSADQFDFLNGAAGDDWLIFKAGEDKVTGTKEASN